MKRYCPLASGSKGNSLYIESDETKILVDAGLSGKELCKRLDQIGVTIEEIDAILVTHEHSDHIRGLNILALKYNIPLFANAETAKAVYHHLKAPPKFKIFSTGETFEFADLYIHPFSIPHDAIDPVAFTFQTHNIKLGVCTDLGFVTPIVREAMQSCDYMILESNHEPDMVHASRRPASLKARIMGRTGHLSNEQAGTFLQELSHANLAQVHLGHLSGECNCPEKALQVVNNITGGTIPLAIAHQHQTSLPVNCS